MLRALLLRIVREETEGHEAVGAGLKLTANVTNPAEICNFLCTRQLQARWYIQSRFLGDAAAM